jgi:hypothetical protein
VAGEGRRRILSEAAVGIGGAFLGRSGIGAELFLITRKFRTIPDESAHRQSHLWTIKGGHDR